MNSPTEIYLDAEVISQAQIEGANYVRALACLMEEFRTINEHTKLLPYFGDFTVFMGKYILEGCLY